MPEPLAVSDLTKLQHRECCNVAAWEATVRLLLPTAEHAEQQSSRATRRRYRAGWLYSDEIVDDRDHLVAAVAALTREID